MKYTLTVDAEDIEVIGQGLDELKLKVAAPVAARLQAQITAQNIADSRKAEQPATLDAAIQPVKPAKPVKPPRKPRN